MSLLLNFSPKKSFYPAVLKHYKSIGYVIEWYFLDERTDKMVRRMVRLQHVHKRTSEYDFRIYANRMIAQINQELSIAYPASACVQLPTSLPMDNIVSTIAPTVKPEKRITIKEAADKFLAEKEKELRPDSMRSYRSYTKLLIEWGKDNDMKTIKQLDKENAIDFMDYLYNDREVSACSFNNYLKLSRCFASWCVSKNLMEDNPFAIIKKKRTDGKNRTLIPEQDRIRLMEHEDIRSGFKVICMLVYSALIRPKEISKLQIKHVHLDQGYIEVPGTVAKNHKRRMAALTPQLQQWLSKMQLDRYSPNDYLFGSKLEPSSTQSGTFCYMKYWRKVREWLDYPITYTLYSFRDTGITEMLESGMPSVDVMKHADHSSLDITTTYVQHEDKELIRKIATHAPKF